MGNIESKQLDDLALLLCEWSDSFAKPIVDKMGEKIQIFCAEGKLIEDLEKKLCEWSDAHAKPLLNRMAGIPSENPHGNTRGSIMAEMKPYSSSSIGPSIDKEIVVKCSIEEMMKAFFKDYVIIWHDPNANNQQNQ